MEAYLLSATNYSQILGANIEMFFTSCKVCNFIVPKLARMTVVQAV
jgi:hypothetical protein